MGTYRLRAFPGVPRPLRGMGRRSAGRQLNCRTEMVITGDPHWQTARGGMSQAEPGAVFAKTPYTSL